MNEPLERRERRPRRERTDAGPVEGRPDPGPQEPGTGRTPATQQLGRVVVVLVAVLFAVFALTNAHYVDFSWVFARTEVIERGGERLEGGVRLIVLLLAAFAAGAVVAGIVAWQSARRRRAVDDT